MTPDQLNTDLANRLGRNPLGHPLYRWQHSENYMHLMRVNKTTEAMIGEALYRDINSRTSYHEDQANIWLDDEDSRIKIIEPAEGILLVGGEYVWRKMCDLENTWILTHWHDPMSQFAWEQTHGGALLWPREGYYSPTNIVLGPGEEITQTSNDQAVYLIKKQDEKTFADHMADGEKIVEKRESRDKAKVSDIVDDSCSAFSNIPGTRSAHVQFPSYGADRKQESA
jgi:hypothetical protein